MCTPRWPHDSQLLVIPQHMTITLDTEQSHAHMLNYLINTAKKRYLIEETIFPMEWQKAISNPPVKSFQNTQFGGTNLKRVVLSTFLKQTISKFFRSNVQQYMPLRTMVVHLPICPFARCSEFLRVNNLRARLFISVCICMRFSLS